MKCRRYADNSGSVKMPPCAPPTRFGLLFSRRPQGGGGGRCAHRARGRTRRQGRRIFSSSPAPRQPGRPASGRTTSGSISTCAPKFIRAHARRLHRDRHARGVRSVAASGGLTARQADPQPASEGYRAAAPLPPTAPQDREPLHDGRRNPVAVQHILRHRDVRSRRGLWAA